MKRLIALLAALAALMNPHPCHGGKWVNGTTGNDSNAGTIAAPWATIAKACNSTGSNDTVYIAAKGTAYADGIIPTADNVSFVGDSTAPNKVIIPSIFLNRKTGLYVNGVRVTGTVGQDAATSCSGTHIRNSVLVRGFNFNKGGPVAILSCRVGTDSAAAAVHYAPWDGMGLTGNAPIFKFNTMRLRPADRFDTGFLLELRQGEADMGPLQNMVFSNNDVTFTIPENMDANLKVTMLQTLKSAQIMDNKFTFNDSTGGGGAGIQGWLFRDYITYNKMYRDTFIAVPLLNSAGRVSLLLTGSGHARDEDHNTWSRCVVKSSIPITNPVIFEYGLGERDSVTLCQFVTSTGIANSGPAIYTNRGNSVVYKNTFATFDAGGALQIGLSGWGTGTMEVASNIFYTPRTTNISGEQAVFYSLPASVPSDVIVANNNVNLHLSGNSRDVGWRVVPGGNSASAIGSAGAACITRGWECSSIHASPRFVDSTYATFYPRMTNGSALTAGKYGENAGAIDSTTDATVPGNIVDASVLGTGLENGWPYVDLIVLATGDNATSGTATKYAINVRNYNGSAGEASGVQLRNRLDDGSESYVFSQTRPAVAGTYQILHCLLEDTTGILPDRDGRLFFIELKAMDEYGNVSAAWSNTGTYFTMPTN